MPNMIRVDIRPRQDNKYDIYVADDNGEELMNSSQGYENVEDAETVVRRCFGAGLEPPSVVMKVTYRDGKTKTEQVR